MKFLLRKKKVSFFTILILSIFFLGSFLYVSASSSCKENETEDQCRIRLENEIKKKEAEIKKIENDIKKENGNQKNLAGEIQRLRNEINKTSLAIRKKSLRITDLHKRILEKEDTLQKLNEKLKREKESLEKILRDTYELGDTTLFEFILSNQRISQFYEDFSSFSSLQASLSRSFQMIDRLKFEIYGEKKDLESKKEKEANEKYSLGLEKGKIEAQKKNRNLALEVSKSKEANLAALKKKRQEEIKKIRSALIRFRGNGIQSKPLSFGEAYDYAKFASQKTGVRTAFIMAIMQQETGFGKNVGGCFVTNLNTGDGVGMQTHLSYEKVMNPESLPYFKYLTEKLGLDFKKTPVSCPIDIKRVGSARKYYPGRGYGGAMGYTQFIPSSWKLVASRVQSFLQKTIANPWNPQDAVMATGVFLKDKGADKKTYSAEYQAACRYYGACGSYATSVMQKAASIQKSIYILEQK